MFKYKITLINGKIIYKDDFRTSEPLNRIVERLNKAVKDNDKFIAIGGITFEVEEIKNIRRIYND